MTVAPPGEWDWRGDKTVSFYYIFFNVRTFLTFIIKNTLKCNANYKEKPQARAQGEYQMEVELL